MRSGARASRSWKRGPLLANKLMDERLACLPDAVEQALQASIDSYATGGQVETREHLTRAVLDATEVGFL
jgi:hypothetical protein